MNLGQRIKELRLNKKMTQKQLASALNYSNAIIAYWENNERKPTADAIIKMAVFFDVSSDYILGLENEYGLKIKIDILC